ncbi:MAG: hypothetical protein NZ551_04840 [Microscillaceae bacterium]|nr:hypothetical protein [Microscillaceae bacterium]MDW8460520.1 hypothetical protein [Cytophagales bacterium]
MQTFTPKRKHLFYTLVMLGIIPCVYLFSCKGKEAKPKTKAELLAQNEWRGEVAEVTISSFVFNQKQDQNISTLILKFEKDGTFRLRNGNAPEQKGNWELLNNDQQIRLKNANVIDFEPLKPLLPPGATLPPIPELFDVLEITAENFKFQGKTNFSIPVQDFPMPIPIQIDFKPNFVRNKN